MFSGTTPVTSWNRSENHENRRSAPISQNQSEALVAKSRNRASLSLIARTACTRCDHSADKP